MKTESGDSFLDAVRLSQAQIDELLNRVGRRDARPRRRAAPSGAFIPGPIPLTWLVTANRAQANGLVAVMLWRYARMRRRHRGVITVSTQAMAAELGGSRQWVSRQLRRLERAKLITVERRPGHQLRITIVAHRDDEGGE